MNILVVSRAYGEQAGGMERLSFEFIEAAQSFPELNMRVIANQTRPGSSLLSVRLRSILFAVGVIPRILLAARAADVIHIGDPVLSLAGWLAKKIYKKPVVVTVHGLDIVYRNSLYQFYLRTFFRDFDMYLPISTYIAQKLEEHAVRGRIHVLTPGVKDTYFDPTITRHNLDVLLGMNTAGKKILFTSGRLIKRKGHEWFIRNVLPNLPEHYVYVIAGSGPEAGAVSHAIEEAKQAGRVRMLGRVSNDNLKTLYNTIDMFIQPNVAVQHDSEGFGLVLLEAATCKRVVIASNIEGIPSAIHNEKNGWLVKTKDSQEWINAIQQKLPLPNAREYTLSTFGWPKVMNQYYRLVSAFGTR